MTHHFVMHVAYDGSSYFGWQKTRQGPSIEATLEQVLSTVFSSPVTVRAASRTDRGVHALGQVVDFFVPQLPKREVAQLLWSVNQLLPPNIRCCSLLPIGEQFHPTLSAVKKLYRYHIVTRRIPSPWMSLTSWHVPYPLDISAMQEAALLCLGRHNFLGFATDNKRYASKNTVRSLYAIRIQLHHEMLTIEVEGDTFLYKMVRTLVGTLVWVGRGKLSPSCMSTALQSHQRSAIGVTAPAQGLFLVAVSYPESLVTQEFLESALVSFSSHMLH